MATINSTLISGAGAFTALLPLLTGKQRILLVTDGNVGKLDAARQIRTLLEDEGRQVQIVDSVPAEPSQHDMTQILRLVSANQPELIVGIGGGSVSMWPSCSRFCCIPTRRGLRRCWPAKSRSKR